jgi:hypothetical protein
MVCNSIVNGSQCCTRQRTRRSQRKHTWHLVSPGNDDSGPRTPHRYTDNFNFVVVNITYLHTPPTDPTTVTCTNYNAMVWPIWPRPQRCTAKLPHGETVLRLVDRDSHLGSSGLECCGWDYGACRQWVDVFRKEGRYLPFHPIDQHALSTRPNFRHAGFKDY